MRIIIKSGPLPLENVWPIFLPHRASTQHSYFYYSITLGGAGSLWSYSYEPLVTSPINFSSLLFPYTNAMSYAKYNVRYKRTYFE